MTHLSGERRRVRALIDRCTRHTTWFVQDEEEESEEDESEEEDSD